MGNPEYARLLSDALEAREDWRDRPSEGEKPLIIKVSTPESVAGYQPSYWTVFGNNDFTEPPNGMLLAFSVGGEPTTFNLRRNTSERIELRMDLIALGRFDDGGLWIGLERICDYSRKMIKGYYYVQGGKCFQGGLPAGFVPEDICRTFEETPKLLEMLARPLPPRIDFNATFERLVAALESGEFVNPNDLLVPVTDAA